jgi:hypothetical protein
MCTLLILRKVNSALFMKAIGVRELCFIFSLDRVTQIYTIPNKDILITVSESNVKVWDLEYDECIKNMNEHNSSIVYLAQKASNKGEE